ncbi:MAG: ATP-dependent sacrificial sulfur transferase LarE [Paracoccus sp. (in: a-proteobacteria)]
MDNYSKELRLKEIISNYDRLAIAYSGGIDSTYLLKISIDVLGIDNVLAVVVNSELFSDDEFIVAKEIASDLGINCIGVEMQELVEPKIYNNTPEGWYFSKKLLYKTIRKYSEKHGYNNIVDGMIMDDIEDFRPGLLARDEENISSPLQTANLYKEEIRNLAQINNISTWNKEASCSIASRFPYYTKITQEDANKIFLGEKFLKNLGCKVIRLRIHNNIARIEVNKNNFNTIMDNNSEIVRYIRSLGFDFVTMDIEGFRSGRMNELLNKETLSINSREN